MDGQMTAQLPQGWAVEEEEDQSLPTGWTVESQKPEYNDVVTQELNEQGFETDVGEEFERAAELGTAGLTKSLASGASVGISENIPGLEAPEGIVSDIFKAAGTLLPLSRLIRMFQAPLVGFAAKSPVFQRQLTALAKLTGMGLAGGTYEVAEKGIAGEEPTVDDFLIHGATWAAIDAALNALGYSGRFLKSLLTRAEKTGEPAWKVLNASIEAAREAGIDASQPDRVALAALEALEGEAPIIERQLTASKEEIPEAIESAQEALSFEPVSAKDLTERKVSPEGFNALEKKADLLAEPYSPHEINLEEELDSLAKTGIEEDIEQVAERAATEKELGENIQKEVIESREAAFDELAPLYDEAKQAAEVINHDPNPTLRLAYEALEKIESLKTRPAGYANTTKTLENVIEDLGYALERDPESGRLIQAVQKGDVSVAKQINLAERINKIVDYESLDRSITDVLKPINRQLKKDIRTGLKPNPDAETAFDLAEKEYAQVAERYGTDVMRKVRSAESGERVAQFLKSPTALQELRGSLSPQQYAQIERELLEKLQGMSYQNAKKALREIRPQLRKDTQRIADNLIEAKNPQNRAYREKQAQKAALQDISKALTTGERPTKALNLWKTSEGRALVKDALKGSPNAQSVEKYLARQSFEDMVDSIVTKDGAIDFKKLKTFMQDKATYQNIAEVGGQEAAQFFKELESRIEQIKHNVSMAEKLPRKQYLTGEGRRAIEKTGKANTAKSETSTIAEKSLETQREVKKESTGELGKLKLKRMIEKDYPLKTKIDEVTALLGINGKTALSVFGLIKFGLPSTVKAIIATKLLYRLATNKRLQKKLIDASRHYNDPRAFIAAFESLGDELDDLEEG